MSGQRTALAEWKDHWPLVLAAMVGVSFYSVVTYSLGTFMEPLEQEFGWKRAQVSAGLTIFGLIATLGGPFVGMTVDRFGSRRPAIIGLIAIGAAFAAFGTANGSLVQWFGLWIVFGIAALFTKTTVWSVGTSSVFQSSRGLALAAVLSGSALGQSFAPMIANWLIEAHGWRTAYAVMGTVWPGIGLLLVLLFYFDAHDHGRKTRSDPTTTQAPLSGLTAREAARDSRIIRIAIGNLLMSLVGSGVSVHLVPIISETGIPRGSAVEMAALAGIGGLVGKFLTGWLLDRTNSGVIPFLSFAVAAVGHVLLLNLLGSSSALILASMILGYASGAGLQVTAYLTSRYAGLRAYGTVYGTIGSMMMLGTALGPVLAGLIHDATGAYSLMLLIAAPTMLLTALLFLRLGPYPTFSSEAVAEHG